MAKKSKGEKGKKTYSDEKEYKSFNTLDYKSLTAEALIESLHANAAAVLKEHDLPVNTWSTLAYLEKQVIKLWDAEEYFIRFWLDRLVEEFGFMIWNDVNKKYFNEDWYKKGILHDVPALPKKLRGSPEAVAEHFADGAIDKYRGHYK